MEDIISEEISELKVETLSVMIGKKLRIFNKMCLTQMKKLFRVGARVKIAHADKINGICDDMKSQQTC